jgi:hypothetical protein
LSLIVCGFSLENGCGCSCCEGLVEPNTGDCCGGGTDFAGCCCCDLTASDCGCDSQIKVNYEVAQLPLVVGYSPLVTAGFVSHVFARVPVSVRCHAQTLSRPLLADNLRKHLLFCVWLK